MRNLIGFGAAAVLLVLSAFAQPAAAIDVKGVKSPKGVTAWLVQDRTAPVIHMAFAFRPGALRDPAGHRTRHLAVEAMVAGGRLRVDLIHGAPLAEASVARLAEAYARALRELIEHCRAPDAGGFTPSDFPEAGLDQASLDAVLARLGGG